jgi:MFS transporter, PPP family, 3-phenylpropionic acid transporter
VPLPVGGRSKAPVAMRTLFRDRRFVAVLLAASLIQASHAVYYAFSTITWSAAGLGGGTIAALWALGVVSEIVLFALSARLPHWLSPNWLLAIGGAGGALRWALMSLDPPAMALPLLQLLHALSFGTTHLGALIFLTRAVPPALGARAQGTLSVALGIAMAASMSLSGWLYAAYGTAAYAAMALMALAGGACALGANRLGGDAAR